MPQIPIYCYNIAIAAIGRSALRHLPHPPIVLPIIYSVYTVVVDVVDVEASEASAALLIHTNLPLSITAVVPYCTVVECAVSDACTLLLASKY